MVGADERDKRESHDEKACDASLVNFLEQIGAKEPLNALSSGVSPINMTIDPELIGKDWSTPGKRPVEISRSTLEAAADRIVDAILSDAQNLIDQGEYYLALGHIQEGFRRLLRSLCEKAGSVDAVFRRAADIHGQVQDISAGLGAPDFTLSFSMGLFPSITVSLHFKSLTATP